MEWVNTSRPEVLRADTSTDDPYALPLSQPELAKLERDLGAFSLHRLLGVSCAAVGSPELISPNFRNAQIVELLPPVEAHSPTRQLSLR